jgi:hypothetical protein
MTHDPFIKPLIAHLNFIEGPPVCVKRSEAKSFIWSYANGSRAVIVTSRPRAFANCRIVESHVINFNQPDDYAPKAWRTWCNAARSEVEVRLSQLQATERLVAKLACDNPTQLDLKKAFTALGRCVLVLPRGEKWGLVQRNQGGKVSYYVRKVENGLEKSE